MIEAIPEAIKPTADKETIEDKQSAMIEIPDFVSNIGETDKVPQLSPNRQLGRRVVTLVEFKGDPRRVPGHPSNPTNDMVSAYIKQQPGSRSESIDE